MNKNEARIKRVQTFQFLYYITSSMNRSVVTFDRGIEEFGSMTAIDRNVQTYVRRSSRRPNRFRSLFDSVCSVSRNTWCNCSIG